MTVLNILDDATVAGLQLPKDRREEIFWDGVLKGFGFRLHWNTKGRLLKCWLVQYRHEGKQRKRNIGNGTLLSADKARMRAMKMLVKVEEGVDPAVKQDQQAKALSFQQAVKQYLELKTDVKSIKHPTLYLTNPKYFGSLHTKAMHRISRGDISTAIDKITASGTLVTAKQARAHLSSFMTWAMQRGHLGDVNPMIGSASAPATKGRERVLSDDEVRVIWNALRDDDYGRIAKLLFLTGCRRSEIGELRWSEIDLGAGTFTLPAERCKNGQAHTLPLTPMMTSIIKSVPKRDGRDPLFGTKGKGYTAFDNYPGLDDGIAEEWKLHDLRRTVATRMADIGVQPHIIETILNHVSGHKAGVAGKYNKSKYDAEVKTAMLRWARHVESIISGDVDNVVGFSRSA